MKSLLCAATVSMVVTSFSLAEISLPPGFRIQVVVRGGSLLEGGSLSVDAAGFLVAADPSAGSLWAVDPAMLSHSSILTGLPLSSPGQVIFGDGSLRSPSPRCPR